LRAILQEADYKVGTFTSPYFEQFNERISTNGTPITDDELVQLANVVKPLSDELEGTELGGPTEFEVITAMSFYYFAFVNPVDVAVYEVGLGGRFDSTNVVNPLLSIITNIGLDHTNILGETYKEIAFEKAGIIKSGVGIISAVKQPEALEVIQKTAEEKKAALFLLGKEFHVQGHQSTEHGERFTVKTIYQTLEDGEISMIGKHQTENAALAVMGSYYLKNFFAFIIEEDHIRKGLQKAYWPGRFEIVSQLPPIIMDGAHNEEGIDTLVNELKKRYHDKRIQMVFAALRDKKLDQMISKLDQIAERITFVDFDYPRAAKAEALYEISQSQNKQIGNNWKQTIESEIKSLGQEDMLVITGSLYFLSQAKPYLQSLL
jgi:dihydrofolate synthase/folylpolyglutamate synthase